MSRQGIDVSNEYLDDMRHIITALGKAGKARMFVSRTAKGEMGSMAVMALDQYRAYYLFGANDPALRDTHCGSAVSWDAFAALAESGVRLVDMEGVNSPRRGWFKLSFGAIMQTYYELALR
jgi:lipid II:glycine glycyltransferase (peptidoglycan interpeptide bridge formation enzyme)